MQWLFAEHPHMRSNDHRGDSTRGTKPPNRGRLLGWPSSGETWADSQLFRRTRERIRPFSTISSYRSGLIRDWSNL